MPPPPTRHCRSTPPNVADSPLPSTANPPLPPSTADPPLPPSTNRNVANPPPPPSTNRNIADPPLPPSTNRNVADPPLPPSTNRNIADPPLPPSVGRRSQIAVQVLALPRGLAVVEHGAWAPAARAREPPFGSMGVILVAPEPRGRVGQRLRYSFAVSGCRHTR
ncbi:hypothetical protein GCM10022222_44990 [Amycolatopsis ultiminotia]|uniref:Uncharacterized protein n=1 Tax=Amycolatopsis ultiminotia TaxID=543629 RepID=A0ABP6WTA8_9PSEU